MNKKILGISLAMMIVMSLGMSVVVIANPIDATQMWVDLIDLINHNWAEAMQIAVTDAYQRGRDSKHCGGGHTSPEPIIEEEEEEPQETQHLMGDANGDGEVNSGDYASVKTNFGNVCPEGEWCAGDANQDGIVSAGDYSSIQSNFGRTN